mmetsp:Transcript_1614/g.3090  ORF Transcript_1614/g.3090 Transcript_1614/m.3090 type:complete len:139 (-) Transcript_1614:1009-1425(-)
MHVFIVKLFSMTPALLKFIPCCADSKVANCCMPSPKQMGADKQAIPLAGAVVVALNPKIPKKDAKKMTAHCSPPLVALEKKEVVSHASAKMSIVKKKNAKKTMKKLEYTKILPAKHKPVRMNDRTMNVTRYVTNHAVK